jgi:MFS family permease
MDRHTTPHSKSQRHKQAAAEPAVSEHELAQRTRAGRKDATVGFAAICFAYFAIILDGSVLNVAIPSIRDSLNGSMAEAQWVLNGYTLALAALLLTGGVMGDRIGLRRALLWGTGVFTLASAACAVVPTVSFSSWLESYRASAPRHCCPPPWRWSQTGSDAAIPG